VQGYFDVEVKDAGGLKDADFEAAIREGRLDDVLSKLNTEQRAASFNQLHHWIVPTIYHNLWGHGFANGPWPTYDQCMWCNNIGLMVTDSEPTFNEAYGWYGGYHQYADNTGDSTCAKGMTAHRAEYHQIDKNADGREEIFLSTRFLFLPSQGNSNNIRSLGLFGSQYSNQGTGGEDRYRSARVRLKDPDTGLPTIIIKNLNQVLVIEYTIFWVSL